MANIEELIAGGEGVTCEALRFFKAHPQRIAQAFERIKNAGFTDFEWVAAGSSSFLIAPTDNPDIVFRITNESTPRRDDCPFFLAGPCITLHEFPEENENIGIELLLRGNPQVMEADKDKLCEEMQAAGWQMHSVRYQDGFWKDIVMLSLRDDEGRTKKIPIISDPSAMNFHMDNCRPSTRELPDGSLQAPNLNSCGATYATLQDQAKRYNALREEDPRVKSLLLQPVVFLPTHVISQPASKLVSL